MARIALIAHDDQKEAMVDLVETHEEILEDCDLVATGTTGGRIIDATGLDVERKASGPVGGDAQIAAEIPDGRVDESHFLRDPLRAQPHEPDITALLRLSDVHDIPLTTTSSGAEYLLRGIGRELDEP